MAQEPVKVEYYCVVLYVRKKTSSEVHEVM